MKTTLIYKSMLLATVMILSAGNIQAQCFANYYEPNNSFTQGTPLSPNAHVWTNIGYSGDLDYYLVYVHKQGIFSITLDGLPLDYDLRVYNASGTQLSASFKGGTAAEYISINVLQPNYYYIRVEGYNGANSQTCYHLYSSLTENDCLDLYESNNTLATSRGIPLNQQINAKISSYTDQDWFKITTPASTPYLKVTLSNPNDADYDLSLYNSNGALLNTSANSSITGEQIVYNNPFTVTNTYYIKVYSHSQATNNRCYTLKTYTSGSAFRADEEFEYTEDNNVVTAMSMYPNPAIAGQLLTINLNVNATLEKISILNINGETVSQQKIILENGKATINLEGIAPGIYILDAGEAGKQKLVVQ